MFSIIISFTAYYDHVDDSSCAFGGMKWYMSNGQNKVIEKCNGKFSIEVEKNTRMCLETGFIRVQFELNLCFLQ